MCVCVCVCVCGGGGDGGLPIDCFSDCFTNTITPLQEFVSVFTKQPRSE